MIPRSWPRSGRLVLDDAKMWLKSFVTCLQLAGKIVIVGKGHPKTYLSQLRTFGFGISQVSWRDAQILMVDDGW